MCDLKGLSTLPQMPAQLHLRMSHSLLCTELERGPACERAVRKIVCVCVRVGVCAIYCGP